MIPDSSEVLNNNQDQDGPKKSSLASFTPFTVDNKKPKKRVTWAPEDKLQDISYFEVDETERGTRPALVFFFLASSVITVFPL